MAADKNRMIVKAWRDPNSNISLDEYSYRLVAKNYKN